ncbi:MAG TPA: gamma-glutamyltransferase [Solirubrobacteraceae bacterium]|jgi:gamma-glutamyltranspeptidase/glutathione hydrolase|nr:gamma-glutamyltransferase [Solirubrobacteraceae bacterium]
MVCAIDHLAAGAGAEILRHGGSAVDAAIAASAVLAVTSQHMCGMGGDLWAVIHPGSDRLPVALNASGRAGSGADPDALRGRGLREMPDGEVAAVTVPGCVDGWLALHERFGRMALPDVLGAASRYAGDGFPASPELAGATEAVAGVEDAADYRVAGGVRTGTMIRRPGAARALTALAAGGRDAFYGGEFGEGLLALGGGEFSESDLARPQADWVGAISADAWGHRLWTAPPNSQGYLTLSTAWIADELDLQDPADPDWAHLLIESARQSGYDRLEVLHEHADATTLLAPGRLAPRRAAIDRGAVSVLPVPVASGDTIAVCAVDADRQGISLIQSNAGVWGSRLVVPGLGIFLHNRGRGFSLRPGHPAEYRPGRRPPHTLSPTLVTDLGGELRAVLGTMGGDSQPQILVQLLARLLRSDQSAGDAMHAGRFVLAPPADRGIATTHDRFSTWSAHGNVTVRIEGHASPSWADGLRAIGHAVACDVAFSDTFGHAQLIDVGDGVLRGATDPRARAGSAAGC